MHQQERFGVVNKSINQIEGIIRKPIPSISSQEQEHPLSRLIPFTEKLCHQRQR